MTTYRYVCPRCSAYITSRGIDSDSPTFWEDWIACAETWQDEHVCGQDYGDGIERPSEYARYEGMSDDVIDDLALVAPKDGCPECGERQQDKLIWHGDEFVECMTCGCRYLP